MDIEAYSLMASHEADHWWFVGRRAVLRAVLSRLDLPANARILEAGCGTGGNLYFLKQLGDVAAFEPHAAALEISRARHPEVKLEAGALPDALPFAGGTFDLVAALDVLEHVDDDAAALDALIALAKPGGHVIISVPTHPILFGSHDRRLHHVRRYDVGELRRMMAQTGCELRYFGAYNTVLAPLAFGLRLAEKVLPLNFGNQERRPTPLINASLAWLFGIERFVARRTPIPFGLSHVIVLRVP